MSEPMFVGILRCRDCGAELNRTKPVTEEHKSRIALFSAFAASNCPNGCRSTWSDLNINTDLSWEPAPCEPMSDERLADLRRQAKQAPRWTNIAASFQTIHALTSTWDGGLVECELLTEVLDEIDRLRAQAREDEEALTTVADYLDTEANACTLTSHYSSATAIRASERLLRARLAARKPPSGGAQ